MARASLKQTVRDTALRALTRWSHVTGRTPDRDLMDLIRQLRPVRPRRELIRVGPRGDGGYLVPDDLDGLAACFSPGVGPTSGFERECAERGIPVFLADRSVEAPPEQHPLFHFTRRYVGAITNPEFMTLDDWVAESLPGDSGDLLLQIDIEGHEYEVLLNATGRLLQRARIIVIEFHHLEVLWSAPFFMLARRAFEKLLQGHDCVHLHPNNCCGTLKRGEIEIPGVMEFTFVRRDHTVPGTRGGALPHPLDCDNTTNPPLPLPRCWQD